MKDKNAPLTPETGASEAARRRGKTVSSLFAVLLILTMLFTMVFSACRQYAVELDAAYASLRSSVCSLRSLISFEGQLEDFFRNFGIRQTSVYAELTKPFFDYFGVSAETLNACKSYWEAAALYYFPDGGQAITSDGAGSFPLDKSRTHALEEAGIQWGSDWVYSAVRLQDGWLYMKWVPVENIYNVNFERIAEACPGDLCIVENDTGRILVSSDEQTYDFLDESRITFDEERSSTAADGIRAGFLRGKAPLSGVFFEKSSLLDRYSVFVYVSVRAVLAGALRKTLPVHGLILLCFLFIWFCARKLRAKGSALPDRESCLRLGTKNCFSLSVMRQLLPLLLAGILSISAIATYLPLLTNYIDHNGKMEKSLRAFVKEIELNDEEWGKMEDIYRRLVLGHVSMIDLFSHTMGEDFTPDVLQDLAQRLGFDSVVIFDGDGVSRMSTTGYTGYTISQNPNDEEYLLWNLLKNADTGIMGELSDKSGFYAAARRLFGTSGLIYVTLPDDSLVTMKEQTDIRAALLRIDTGTYAKMYAAAAAPETLLWAAASSTAVHPIANTLPETALMNRYYGAQAINGYEYYLNTMTDDSHILISAEQFRVFTEPVKKALAVIIPEILLLSLFILCGSCIYPCDDGWLQKEPVRQVLTRLRSADVEAPVPEEQELRREVRKRCSELLLLLCAALVVLYFIDTIYADHPVADYLFSRQWQREPSIFSLTTIILSVLFLIFGMNFLKAVLRALSSKMDSRAETFSDLIVSIVQFLLTVVVVIYSLHELGVDTRVILTSAGVVSLIIGYGSQSIVEDLVSGIFLIMEDQVRIGEYIEIDDFMGKVEHIGLRTTRAAYDNRTKVISNSNMVGFYNLSRDASPACWSVGLPHYVDVERAKSLIVDNAERFRAELGDALIRGPVYLGMSKIQWGGQYVLLFAVFCDIDDWEEIRAASMEICYKIYTENGIRPVSGELIEL